LRNFVKPFRQHLFFLADSRECARANEQASGEETWPTVFWSFDIRADRAKTEAMETVVGHGGDSFLGVASIATSAGCVLPSPVLPSGPKPPIRRSSC